jgi:hypothetical protein
MLHTHYPSTPHLPMRQFHIWEPTSHLAANFTSVRQLHICAPTSHLGANFTSGRQLHIWAPTSHLGANFTSGRQLHIWAPTLHIPAGQLHPSEKISQKLTTVFRQRQSSTVKVLSKLRLKLRKAVTVEVNNVSRPAYLSRRDRNFFDVRNMFCPLHKSYNPIAWWNSISWPTMVLRDGAESQHAECKHAERQSAESQDADASQCQTYHNSDASQCRTVKLSML